MKYGRSTMNATARILTALFIIAFLSPLTAYARGGHGYYHGGGGYYRGGGGGHYHGSIWINPWWFAPYPYYYSVPPVIVERPSTDYYIQQEPQELQQSEEPAYWYYCRKPEGYYPYVKQCPDGWMKVVPTPPPNE